MPSSEEAPVTRESHPDCPAYRMGQCQDLEHCEQCGSLEQALRATAAYVATT